MIDIRFAEPKDISTILRFVHELAAFEREPDAVKATEAMLHTALFEQRAAEALIAEQGGKPVGMAVYFHNFSTWTGRRGIYLEDLYVTPDARGLGVGTSLLRKLAAVAVERDCARFEWSVLDWNEKAINFYRSMGAEPMSEWTVQRVSGDALKKLAGGT